MGRTRWDPYGEVLSVRQVMDRLLEDAMIHSGRPSHQPAAGSGMDVALDLAEHEDELEVTASLPGVKPDDVEITIQNNVLTIQGELRDTHEQRSGTQAWDDQSGSAQSRQRRRPQYHYRERRYGRFVRRVTLPAPVDVDGVEATFEHGVLRITLPKAQQARRQRIHVSGGGSGRPAIEGQVGEPGVVIGMGEDAGQTEPSQMEAMDATSAVGGSHGAADAPLADTKAPDVTGATGSQPMAP